MVKKSSQIIFRTTEAQKDFLLKQSEKEDRTITTIVNLALGEKYPKYKEITKEVKNND